MEMRSPLLMDKDLPYFDVALARQVIVDADPATVLQAVKELDFMTVHSRLLDLAMWVRACPSGWLDERRRLRRT